MIPILSTRDMEAAVPLLAKRCGRVIVRAHYQCEGEHRIRLRVRALELPLQFTTSDAEGNTVVSERWAEKGGTLINFQQKEPEAPHEAKLFCECPISLDDLNKWTLHTSVVAVVYLPPTWSPQEERLAIRYPTAEVCRNFYDALKETITDTELCFQLDLTARQLAGVRRSALQGRYWNIHYQFIPRAEPEDKSLMTMYKAICEHPTPTKQELRKVATSWRRQVRALVRCGSVGKQPDVGFYDPAMPEPDYQRITSARTLAEKKFDEIRRTIEQAPELTAARLKALCPARQAKPRLSIAPAPPEAAARARDTDR